MKLADYVADFLARQGIRHVFAITGGASVHMIEAVANHPGIDYVCPHHEQAAAMAADAYARASGGLGAAIATSGPGATNLITGIGCAWFDSVPVLYLTGQVATFRFKADSGVRQIGFQETDIVEICRPITKFAVTVTDPRLIRHALEQAVWTARNGRPGPVLVDIPDDLQRATIDPGSLEGFSPPPIVDAAGPGLERSVRECLDWLAEAERPIVVLGWGVRLSGAEAEALAFVERLGTPVTPTWGAADLMPESHPLRVGTFGTHGTRFGNFAIQNADLVVAIGSRLDTHMVGSPCSTFCRGGRKVVVDIDPAEPAKFRRFGLDIDLPVIADARTFLTEALGQSEGRGRLAIESWHGAIARWKSAYPQITAEHLRSATLNPYAFVGLLSDSLEEGDVVIADTGCTVAWLGQAFRFKRRQRFLSAFNNTPMGYGLPAALGASFALPDRRIVCVCGDGGLMMNIQELVTVLHHRRHIKIILMNNHGYGMVRQTQDQWFQSKYEATTPSSGLGFPDFRRLAEALGYETLTVATNEDAAARLAAFLNAPGPGLCNVDLRPDEKVVPQVVYGRPIEDAEPLLPRDEFLQNMIVEPMEISRKVPT